MRTDSFSKEKHLPVRRFIADESKVATGLYGPRAIADDIDNIHAMFDPDADILDGDEKGGISEKNLQDGAVSYPKLSEDVRGKVEGAAAQEELNEIGGKLTEVIDGKADKSDTLSGYGITDAYTKAEMDGFLSQKAAKATTLSGYGITDAYEQAAVNSMLANKQNISDNSLETEAKTIVGAINELKEAHGGFIANSQYDIDKNALQESIDKKCEETILYEVTVNTSVWTNQPDIVSGITVDYLSKGEVYYVTLNDADGNALTDGQFMLKDFYTEGATVYPVVFSLADLNTGTGTLVENHPVEIGSVGVNPNMRDAGVRMVTFDINKSMDSSLHLKITTIGEFLKTHDSDYFVSDFHTNQGVSTYHSIAATTWNSDSDKYIRHYIGQGADASKIRKIRDDFSISKKDDQYFATERKHLSRVLPYGTTSYKNYSGQSIGFGQAEAGTMLLKADVYSASVHVSTISPGYIRNGSVVRVTEVK